MTSLRILFDLQGRVALITGGSRGLGFQIAEALGEFGAMLVIAARKKAELDEAASRLTAQGCSVHTIVVDLGAPGAHETLIDQVVAREGRLDILVNSAGVTWGAKAEEYPVSGWNKVLDLNVTGLFLLTQAAAKRCFIPQGSGVVLNLASIEGLQGHHPRQIGTVAYNTAKGAVVNMTRALAAEWGAKRIRVNAIAPGFFPSKMTNATLESIGDQLVANTPLGKLGGPDDLKGAALLLVSEAGAHITGQIIVVDGGTTVI
jgi:NAD(P)-dependent dehydrogenase (short-subunit alcohol dehydrogenase family)